MIMISDMLFSQRFLIIVLLFPTCLASLSVLHSASLVLTHEQLTTPGSFTKSSALPISSEFISKHKDVGVLAGMSEFTLDDDIDWWFKYGIVCNDVCTVQWNFKINDKHANKEKYDLQKAIDELNKKKNKSKQTSDSQLQKLKENHRKEDKAISKQKLNPSVRYMVKIDWIVARGMKLVTLNMTDFQEHVFKGNVISYDEKNNLQNNSAIIPNMVDADLLILIPNGFSSLTVTGYVNTMPIPGTDMYVVHYMNMDLAHEHTDLQKITTGVEDKMGWRDNIDWIWYTGIFINKKIIGQHCPATQYFFLKSNFHHPGCKSGIAHFPLFIGTKKPINLELILQSSSFSFEVNQNGFQSKGMSEDGMESQHKKPVQLQYMVSNIPYYPHPYAVDLREHSYSSKGEIQKFGKIGASIVAVIGILILIRRFRKKRENQRQNHERLEIESETGRASPSELGQAM